MQPQQNFSGSGQGPADETAAVVCAQCGAPMPREMRFCRTCGNRLGEGSAEYTETVRLPNGATAPTFRGTTPFQPGYAGPIAAHAAGLPYKRRRRVSGMTWVWIAIAIFFAAGGGLSMLVKNVRRISRPVISMSINRSWVGVNEFRSTDGGVTFDVVTPPGSPADKAGLVGGDIVTSFDGHAVKKQSEIMDLLRQTPVGKTVELIYTRDGVSHTTQLTTISKEAFDELDNAFDSQRDKGMFGFDTDKTTRVGPPESKTAGVRLNYIEANSPADLFGIKEGDIITDFNNVPIRTTAELLSRVRRAPYSAVDVVVVRDGQQIKIPVKLGKLR